MNLQIIIESVMVKTRYNFFNYKNVLKLYFYNLIIMLLKKRPGNDGNNTNTILNKKIKYDYEEEEEECLEEDGEEVGSSDGEEERSSDGTYDYEDSFIDDEEEEEWKDGEEESSIGESSEGEEGWEGDVEGALDGGGEETLQQEGEDCDINNEFNRVYNKSGMTNTSKSYFKSLNRSSKIEILKKIKEIKGSCNDKPKLMKVLDWNTSTNNKANVLNKLNMCEHMENTNEYYKLNNWINQIMKVPFGQYIEPVITKDSPIEEISNYIKDVKNKFDDVIYGHEQSKEQLIKILAQTISNPEEGGNVFALQGPPGVGKTALIQEGIAKALNRPYTFISLGGTKGASFLEGHEYTYEGSNNGRIIDALIETKCMNPIIYFDELDKISETFEGKDVINVLMHITDVTQNKHFNDKYFGSIDFDLSKCILIFSFNDESKVCHILRDRMKIINVKSYKVGDKINIANNFIIPKLLKSINFDNDYKVIFPEEVLKFIIESYTHEGGVRKFKEILYDILLEVNLRRLRDYKKPMKNISNTINLIITKELVEKDFLKKKNKIQLININKEPTIGCVNGLWANCEGIGGLIPIECKWKPSDEKFKLELTGMQGDVMKESMSIALTVATNILPIVNKNELYKSLDKTFNKGIHIHCPDGSTPKDGPSAGCAITVSLVSLFTKIPVKNNVAMTGEINLKGEVTAIGGLEEKLEGAKSAGATIVLCPYENIDTYNDIIEKNKTLINKNFNVMFIKNIWEALDIALTNRLNMVKF